MPKISMRCTKDLVYAGHRVKVGDVFQASGETDARILTVIKKAERYTPPVYVAPPVAAPVARREPAPAYATKVLSQEKTDPVDPVKPKRQYNRRDLTAEE